MTVRGMLQCDVNGTHSVIFWVVADDFFVRLDCVETSYCAHFKHTTEVNSSDQGETGDEAKDIFGRTLLDGGQAL